MVCIIGQDVTVSHGKFYATTSRMRVGIKGKVRNKDVWKVGNETAAREYDKILELGLFGKAFDSQILECNKSVYLTRHITQTYL